MITSLVVSVASHPPRFHMLKPALVAMLSQDVKPAAVVLWLSEDEQRELPEDVRALPGLTIGTCANLRSYKKLVPALAAYPDSHILTGDDDKMYPPTWTRDFVTAYRSDREILLMRGKRVAYVDGDLAPYESWPKVPAGETSPDLFPTSSRGMLVAPGVLCPDFHNMEIAQRLAPHNDDLWWYWMGRRSGLAFRVIAGDPPEHLPTYKNGLFHQFNRNGGNDRQIAALTAVYGVPA
jgi:hypothetical protein